MLIIIKLHLNNLNNKKGFLSLVYMTFFFQTNSIGVVILALQCILVLGCGHFFLT